MSDKTTFEGRGIVKGNVTGPALVSRTPFSFLGDVDIRTGDVIGELSDLRGRNIAGRVLVVPATRYRSPSPLTTRANEQSDKSAPFQIGALFNSVLSAAAYSSVTSFKVSAMASV